MARAGLRWSWISEMPVTQVRFAASIVATLAVIARYICSSTWVPNEAVLLFLGAWLGIDTTHFWLKRKTTDPAIIAATSADAPPPIPGATP